MRTFIRFVFQLVRVRWPGGSGPSIDVHKGEHGLEPPQPATNLLGLLRPTRRISAGSADAIQQLALVTCCLPRAPVRAEAPRACTAPGRRPASHQPLAEDDRGARTRQERPLLIEYLRSRSRIPRGGRALEREASTQVAMPTIAHNMSVADKPQHPNHNPRITAHQIEEADKGNRCSRLRGLCTLRMSFVTYPAIRRSDLITFRACHPSGWTCVPSYVTSISYRYPHHNQRQAISQQSA